jgi:hypothetical protein
MHAENRVSLIAKAENLPVNLYSIEVVEFG